MEAFFVAHLCIKTTLSLIKIMQKRCHIVTKQVIFTLNISQKQRQNNQNRKFLRILVIILIYFVYFCNPIHLHIKMTYL